MDSEHYKAAMERFVGVFKDETAPLSPLDALGLAIIAIEWARKDPGLKGRLEDVLNRVHVTHSLRLEEITNPPPTRMLNATTGGEK